MAAHCFQLLCLAYIIIQRIFLFVRVQNVAGIADRALNDFPRFQCLLNRHLHVFQPVQAVEDTEHIYAALCGNADKFLNHVVRIVCVANRVGGAQKHLYQCVRHRLGKLLQTNPWRFFQETVRYVKRRAAPCLHRERICHCHICRGGSHDQVIGTQSCRHQGLMRVTHGCIRHKQAFFLQKALRVVLRAHFKERILCAAHRNR